MAKYAPESEPGYGMDEMLQEFAVVLKMDAARQDVDNSAAIHPTGTKAVITRRG